MLIQRRRPAYAADRIHDVEAERRYAEIDREGIDAVTHIDADTGRVLLAGIEVRQERVEAEARQILAVDLTCVEVGRGQRRGELSRAGRESRLHRHPDVVQPIEAAFAVASTRSEEHTSELQSLMRTSYAVSCLQ